MPEYLYGCRQCQRRQTIERPIKDQEIAPRCNTCNTEMQRVYTFGAVRFIGKGFASND